MMMEIMGLHLPGSSFINPYTPLRDELTKAAAKQILKFILATFFSSVYARIKLLKPHIQLFKLLHQFLLLK